MGVMFSVSKSGFFQFFLHRNLMIAIISQVMSTILVVYLLVSLGKQRTQIRKLKLSEVVLRQVVEHFPMGIMIIDKKNIIRNVNSAAQKMMFVGN